MYETVSAYLVFYDRYFREQWAHMTPLKYGGLLISIGVFGLILLKSVGKR